jgi:hypothetical protein
MVITIQTLTSSLVQYCAPIGITYPSSLISQRRLPRRAAAIRKKTCCNFHYYFYYYYCINTKLYKRSRSMSSSSTRRKSESRDDCKQILIRSISQTSGGSVLLKKARIQRQKAIRRKNKGVLQCR